MFIVGSTSCPVGIAHTYMAADAIEKYFRKLGHSVKIERIGSGGPENELTIEEIANSDAIINACSGDYYAPERFEPYINKIIEIDIHVALRKPEKVKELLVAKGLYKD